MVKHVGFRLDRPGFMSWFFHFRVALSQLE